MKGVQENEGLRNGRNENEDESVSVRRVRRDGAREERMPGMGDGMKEERGGIDRRRSTSVAVWIGTSNSDEEPEEWEKGHEREDSQQQSEPDERRGRRKRGKGGSSGMAGREGDVSREQFNRPGMCPEPISGTRYGR